MTSVDPADRGPDHSGDSTAAPVDAAARDDITHRRLDSTLFVEAGAGTGKTTQLVERIVHLVLDERVGLAEIAAITFTEAAASELRDRIRERFEIALAASPENDDRRELIVNALRDADVAAISTLHSFAQRILNEHPIAIGLPPRIEVLDEIQSQLAFDDRWGEFLNRLLGRVDIEEVLIRAILLEIALNSTRRMGLRQIALKFNDNWDRLDALAAEEPTLTPIDLAAFASSIDELATLAAYGIAGDKLVERAEPMIEYGGHILAESNPAQQLRLLDGFGSLKKFGNLGKAANWPSDTKEQMLEAGRTCRAAVDDILGVAKHEVLRALAIETAQFTRDSAEERRREGRLEFHDLLVLARRLLRTSSDARTAISRRYRHLLLDEFQDTDPIQIELAVLIASSLGPTDEPIDRHWSDVPVTEGRLFFVGDPKQSIYRFRRAEIELFDRAKNTYGIDGRSIALTQNFRTVEPVLRFINEFFGQVMPPDRAPEHQQPTYRPLSAARDGAPNVDHRPTIIGGAHVEPADGPKITAFDLRRLEAASVADAINAIRHAPSSRRVFDKKRGEWRDPQLRDITILIPTRTSLSHLQPALDDLAIPHRADTGTLVFDTQEVRDVLATLRAIDDPGDEISVVAALRSPLFGISDDHLYWWKSVGGDWDYRAQPPLDADRDHPIARAFAYLNAQHQQRWAKSPSEVIESVINDRRAMQIGCSDDRPRDTWGRLRFIQDQARLFFDDEGGDLRDFLAWTNLQRMDGARVHEPRLDEPDDDAVRIMTIHGSKGLEFPIVFVVGLTTLHANRARGVGVLFPDDDGPPEIKLKADTQTQAFARRADLEETMDQLEKERLLYVALTRARDHLYVSAHHKTKDETAIDNKVNSHSAAVAAMTVGAGTFADTHYREIDGELWQVQHRGPSAPVTSDHTAAPTPVDLDAWRADRKRLLNGLRAPRTLSATRVAQLGVGSSDDDFDADRAADDDAVSEASTSGDGEARLWRRGRAGTAIGRAVHSVLQSLDLDRTNPDDDGGAAAIANLAAAQALAESVPWAAAEIAQTVAAVLHSDVIADLRAAKQHFKELYVAVPLGSTILEGYVDLVIDTGTSLTVIDYKTDRVTSAAEIDAKLSGYRLQGAAYALALELTTGRPVADVAFLFCAPGQATARHIDDLPAAKAQARAIAERQ